MNKPDERLILLVEDREDDVLLIQKAFGHAGISNPLHVTRNGEEAIAYLSGEGAFADRQKHRLPWIVLLDLKMPRKDGFEVLQWIRSVPELRTVTVIVLTASSDAQDVSEAYRLGANSFLVKPAEFVDTVNLAELLQRYWLSHNQFAPVKEMPRAQAT